MVGNIFVLFQRDVNMIDALHENVERLTGELAQLSALPSLLASLDSGGLKQKRQELEVDFSF